MRGLGLIAGLGAALVGIASAQPGAIGCFGDDRSDRVLEAKWTSSVMTPTACAAYCARISPRYTYYATQWGRECWCQDENIDYLRHGDGTCDYECSGDDSIVCGGFDSFSLYDLAQAGLPSSPTDDNYVGCFADDRNDRVLGAKVSFSEMTPEVCAAYCASESSRNMYYATQWGQECWCSAEVDLRNGEGSCDFPCTGDAGITCGGFDAFDLFELEGADPATPVAPPSEGYYLGCFADDRQDRVLGDRTASDAMSLQVCEDYCMALDKPFVALQWGEECWCGGCELLDVEGHRYDRHGGGASCVGHPCTGEASRDCGGFDAFSLYYRGTCGGGSTTGPPTSAPTSSPTLAPSSTVTPTAAPTATPSASPTGSPNGGGSTTVLPTSAPTSSPTTFAPSTTVTPTATPTATPSTTPTAFPPDEGPPREYFTGYAYSDEFWGSVSGVFYLSDEVKLVNRMEVAVFDTIDPPGEPGRIQIFVVDGAIDEVFDVELGQGFKLEYNFTTGNYTASDEVVTLDRRHRKLAQRIDAECVDSSGRDLQECVDELREENREERCEALVEGGLIGAETGCSLTVGRKIDKAVCARLPVAAQYACRKVSDLGEATCDFGVAIADYLFNDCDRRMMRRLQGLGPVCPAASECSAGPTPELLPTPPPVPAPEPPTPEPPAPEPPAPDEQKRGGASDGDPHLRTFDGSRYDCQGQGEFLLTEIASTESKVQVRYQPWGQNPTSAVTINTAIAAREGSSSVIQVTAGPSSDTGEILVDGETYDEVSSDVTGVDLEVTGSRVSIRFPSGLDVFVNLKSGFLNINMYVPISLGTTGLLGNNNGEEGDEWTTPEGETVQFASPTGPTVEEGTNYCTANWCTDQASSIFTYAEGEDHGTYDLCDLVYVPPVIPESIPASVLQLCGDNADCVFDAVLAGEEVGQATLEAEEEARAYQEQFGGLCGSNTFSSTGTPPCTTCPAGEVSGTGATTCTRQELVGLSIPENIAAAMVVDATGGFAGPGSLTNMLPAGTIQLTEEDAGTVSLSGTFARDDGAALPSSTSVFVYAENPAQPDDFVRGQEALDPSTGTFSTVVTDVPAGSSRLFLSFVVVDPAEALGVAGADTVFALDASNAACVPSLTITLDWTGDTSDVDLYVEEPGGTIVFYANPSGAVGFLDTDDTSGFGPENYIIDGGLDPTTSEVLGEYAVSAQLFRGFAATETWRLTARVSGEVAWVEEGGFATSSTTDTFIVSLTDYDASCGVVL